MRVLVAVLPVIGLALVLAGMWVLVRHPRFLVPAAWIVTAVVVVLVALGLALPGPTSGAHRLATLLPALGFVVALWVGVVLLRRRRPR